VIGREWRRVSVSLAYVGSKGVGVKGMKRGPKIKERVTWGKECN